MSEKLNVSFEDVKKVHGDNAKEVFAKIVKITGAGNPGDLHDGGIDLTGLDEGKRGQVSQLLENKNSKKDGK